MSCFNPYFISTYPGEGGNVGTSRGIIELLWLVVGVRYGGSGAPRNTGPRPYSPPRPAHRPVRGLFSSCISTPAPAQSPAPPIARTGE